MHSTNNKQPMGNMTSNDKKEKSQNSKEIIDSWLTLNGEAPSSRWKGSELSSISISYAKLLRSVQITKAQRKIRGAKQLSRVKRAVEINHKHCGMPIGPSNSKKFHPYFKIL